MGGLVVEARSRAFASKVNGEEGRGVYPIWPGALSELGSATTGGRITS